MASTEASAGEMDPVTISSDPESVTGHLALPEGVGPFPAVLLLPAIAGVNDYVKAVAQRLAAGGYLTLLLDYYSREGAAPDVSTPEKIGQAVANLPDPRVLSDIGSALRFLEGDTRAATGKIATWGFCIGGMYSFLAACEYDGVAAAVDYYGAIQYGQLSDNKPVSPLDRAPDLKAPLMGHFGDFDRLISPNDVDIFTAALREHQKNHEFFVYRGAPHAFDEDFRPPVFRPAAAREAWSRSVTFLDWHLKGQAPR